MNEFQIETDIRIEDDIKTIFVCLRCIEGVCASVINKIKEEYGDDDEDQLCLIMIKVEIEEGEEKRIIMTDFYNNVTKYGRGLTHLSEKLKGGARAVLCMLLKKAINAGLINENDFVLLEASGDLEDENEEQLPMENLVNYYKMLGFVVSTPKTYKRQLDNMAVYMHGKVSDLLDKCTSVRVSPELQSVIDRM
jgi:hypothetical protein